MKKTIFFFLFLSTCAFSTLAQDGADLSVVAELAIRPGNVAVSADGRVFSTIHPLGNPSIQLVEITSPQQIEAFPNTEYQRSTPTPSPDKLDTPLGIRIDGNNVLWIIDMGLNLGTPRLFGFDIASRKEVFRYDFPAELAPASSFIQDLAVDEKNGWIYLADIANPGILALNTRTKELRRFADESVLTENVDMVIQGQLVYFAGSPARVAINPITLSSDKNTLYYGAMNGTTWYQVPASLFREGATDYAISRAIKVAGPKPVSDGACTDAAGNHYFTNLQHQGVDLLTAAGELKPFYRSSKIDWPDNVALGPDGAVYITVNQLHKTPAFTGGEDEGRPPFYIYRLPR